MCVCLSLFCLPTSPAMPLTCLYIFSLAVLFLICLFPLSRLLHCPCLQVAKLQRASLHRPVKVEVSHKFATPKTLVQQYLFVPAKYKDCYTTFMLNELAGSTCMVGLT